MVRICALATISTCWVNFAIANDLDETWSDVNYQLSSGYQVNRSSMTQTMFSEVVTIPDAVAVRLFFADVDLGPGSQLHVRSLVDDEVQSFDSPCLETWRFSTAYFNGNTLSVSLTVPAGSYAMFSLDRASVALGEEDEAAPDCFVGGEFWCAIGEHDHRTPAASEPWVARIYPKGCTGTVFDDDSSILTAEHCCTNDEVVAQFNVPSTRCIEGRCTLQQPPVEDQFPIDTCEPFSHYHMDTAVVRVHENCLGLYPVERYGALRRLSEDAPQLGDSAYMLGFGKDDECERSQAAQSDLATVVEVHSRYMITDLTVNPGNSGSAILNDQDEIIGVVSTCDAASRINVSLHDVEVSANLEQVLIGVTHKDVYDRADGTTPFVRTYTDDVIIELIAPANTQLHRFSHWEENGTPHELGERVWTTDLLDEDVQLHAVYAPLTTQPYLTLLAPQENEVINGAYECHLLDDPSPALSMVRYEARQDEHSPVRTVGTTSDYPFSVTWRTHRYADGNWQIRAVGRMHDWVVLSSDWRPVEINNIIIPNWPNLALP